MNAASGEANNMEQLEQVDTGEPTRAEVDAVGVPLLLEFGAAWCPHCQAARPLVQAALERHPGVRFQWIEDGRGRRLGRSFAVKLWPTLIFLRGGREIARLVRPLDATVVEEALQRLLAEP